MHDLVALRDVLAAEGALLVTVDDGAIAVVLILRALDAADIQATAIAVNRPALDDVFLTLTERL